MNVSVEQPSALRRKLTIEIEPGEIARELDRAYNELRRGVQLKGFRPGHAPRRLLERFFGDQVRGDLIQRLVKERTDQALEENGLEPVAPPEIVTEETDLKKALRFTAVFDVKPDIVVRDYEGLKLPESNLEVKDEEIEAALQELRERQATLRKVRDRDTVAEGDWALVSIEGFSGGQPLEGLKPEPQMIEVSRHTVAHGLAELLIGARVGTPATSSKSYAEDYEEKGLAGKTIAWRATVQDIFERELPAIDDDFAKDQGDVNDLADLRARLRQSLLEHKRRESDQRARQGLLDLVIDRNPFDLPESLVERERQAITADLAGALEAGGFSRAQVNDRLEQSAEEIRTRAENSARRALILDAIAVQEGVEVSDEEVAERVAQRVSQSGRNRDRMAEFYRREENRIGLKRAIVREKALDLLVSRAERPVADDEAQNGD